MSVGSGSKKNFSFYSNKREAIPDADQALSLLLSGEVENFKELISRYPHLINAKDKGHGNVALHVVASKGDIALATFLVARGADLNVQDIFGNGPLHYAIDKGKRSVAEMLLNSGANPNLQDFRGSSPLHVACLHNDVDSVKLLIKFNSDPDMSDIQDVKPREKTNSPLIRSLIDRRIQALHGGDQHEAQQTVQWMSFGVGLGERHALRWTASALPSSFFLFFSSYFLSLFRLYIGVGLGVALAKYQQAMIEHQLNIRLDNSRMRRRGNLSSVASFKPLEEGSFGQQPASSAVMPTVSGSHALVPVPATQPNTSRSFNMETSSTPGVTNRKFL